MTTRTVTATGPCPPGEVWERYRVLDRWAEWAPQISGVECAERELTAGASGRLLVPGGVGLSFTIEDVDPAARSWSWRVAAGPVRLRLHHWVDDGPDGGTTTGLRASGPAPLVLLYAPAARQALERLVR